MKMLGFTIMLVATMGGRVGMGETPVTPDMSHWSVVKMVQAGQEAMTAGDKAKARSLAEAAVARDSGYADGWKLLGILRMQAGETNASLQAFRTALLIAPGIRSLIANLPG